MQKKDGVTVEGRLVEVKPELVVVENRTGVKTRVPRSDIASVRAISLTPADVPIGSSGAPSPTASSAASDTRAASERPAPAPDKRASDPAPIELDPAPKYREVTIPSGTLLPLELRTAVASDTSKIEDPVRATLRSAVRAGGVTALPAGSTVIGHVTSAQRSAKVKGRAQVSFRFTQIDPPGDPERLMIRTGVVTRVAEGTKQKDAAKIGAGAGAGAVIGGILGGGSGAAKGAVLGGGAGTAVVLSTRGKEVRLAPGTPVSVRLTAPLTVRLLIK
ncbi:MAG: hypothetical protein LC804_03690 [Acidobacteria bacterium]|nr:hypothetical protein [Acidobacteriota bacterium]